MAFRELIETLGHDCTISSEDVANCLFSPFCTHARKGDADALIDGEGVTSSPFLGLSVVMDAVQIRFLFGARQVYPDRPRYIFGYANHTQPHPMKATEHEVHLCHGLAWNSTWQRLGRQGLWGF